MPHSDGVRSAEFSPDGCFILTACWDSTARLWDANTQQPVELNPILKHSYRVMHASFNPDGHRIVTASVDGVIRVWDLAGRGALPRLVGGSLSADGSHFVTITNEYVQVRPTTSSNLADPCIVTPQPVREARLSRNGRILSTISAPTTLADDSNRTLQLWDAATGKSLSPALPYADTLTNICVSDNGRLLVVCSGNIARLYDAASGKELCPPIRQEQAVARASFSPDSARLVLISGDKVDVRDTATGRALFPTLKHPAGVSHAGFSPDSRLLITCATDNSLSEREACLWSTISGKRVGNVLRHNDGVLYAAFSFDGQRVVTASEDFTAAVWNALSGQRLLPPLKHGDQVMEASFSQDGRWIITASWDQTARVWDAETGEPVSPPLRHPWKVYHAAFVNAGYRVYAAGKDGTAWLWDLAQDNRPSSDLASISQLLAGYRASYTEAEGDPAQRAQRALRGPWDRMHAAYPSAFIVSRDEILAWHRRLADLCETNRQWFSARFHLERLRAMDPDDPTLPNRFAQAQEQLANERKQSKSDGAGL
jgi:WD40 repeat protein